MYAVIETGGKQYRVSPGDSIKVETIEGAEPGATVEFGGVLAASNASGQLVTGSALSSAKVVATVKGAGRADKIIVFKFKRKKQYRRTYGHRQNYTELTVSDIVL